MDPQILEIFQASTSVSQQKGTAGKLMKASTKRRRGKKQIEADKKLEEEKKQEVNNKLAQYAAMEACIAEQEFQLNEAAKMHS